MIPKCEVHIFHDCGHWAMIERKDEFESVVLSFLVQHAVHGWCPPLAALRRMGVRTRREIDEERYALKALRGDFSGLPPDAPRNLITRVDALLDAIRS